MSVLALNGCPSSQNLTWFYKNWTTGGVHDYYIDKGRKDSLAECVDECASQDDCYYATMTTRSRVCYIMTTTSSVACQTAVPSGHFGDHLESCDPLHPCPSAYKICDKPRCSLLDILKSYCLSHDLDDALQGCSAWGWLEVCSVCLCTVTGDQWAPLVGTGICMLWISTADGLWC